MITISLGPKLCLGTGRVEALLRSRFKRSFYLILAKSNRRNTCIRYLPLSVKNIVAIDINIVQQMGCNADLPFLKTGQLFRILIKK